MGHYVYIFCINRNEVSDPKDQDIEAVQPKRQKLDKESREKYDKQSSLEVVGKLNPSKELNQENVELQE